MSLSTFSIFYFGHEVTSDNNKIDFNEGGPDLVAEIDVGKYSLTDYAVAVQGALNTFGTLVYTVALDRTNRLLTISGSATFSLLVSSGDSIGETAFPMIGFAGADRTGFATYQGNLSSGSAYEPQYILQSHVPKENFKKTVSASVNESASGIVEIVRFGSVRFTEFNIQFITDRKTDGRLMKYNPSGVTAANSFMDYVTKVAPIEFMPDISVRNTFQTIQVESTPEHKDGIDYKLRELFDRGLPLIFETGLLRFRVLA